MASPDSAIISVVRVDKRTADEFFSKEFYQRLNAF
jgi:hypothetical protein